MTDVVTRCGHTYFDEVIEVREEEEEAKVVDEYRDDDERAAVER
jgi:hypothetical protein